MEINEYTHTHTLNPNTGRKITINGVRFLKLLKHGFKYDMELNRLYGTPLSPDISKYVIISRIMYPNNRYMIIGGSAYYELLRNNYRQRGSKWVKMSKEEAKEYNNDPNIIIIFALDTDDDYPDEIYELEYDEDGHAIIPF